MFHFGKIITGSHGGETNPSVDIPRYIKLLLNGNYELASMITNRYDLKNINQAIEDIKIGLTVGRVIIKP